MRSTRDLLNTLDAVGRASAGFRSPGDAWADTTTPHGKLMITVLGGLAEFERHLILSRTVKASNVQWPTGSSSAAGASSPNINVTKLSAAKHWGAFGRDRQELQRQSLNDSEPRRARRSVTLKSHARKICSAVKFGFVL